VTNDGLEVLRPGNVLRLWTAVLAATAGYCLLSQLTAARIHLDLKITVLWNVKVWSVWAGLSAALATTRGRRMLRLVWRRPPQRAALVVGTPLLAFMFERLASLALARLGWMEIDYQPAALLYHRLPLYMTATALLIYVLQYLPRPTSAAAPVAPAAASWCITVPTSRGPVSIPVRDIEVIVAAENYVELCLIDGKQYLHRATLTSMHTALSASGLTRVHRSAIVNPLHVIERLPHNRLRLRSGRVVRVGRAYRSD
jgi:LytTr DNA-binding domain-containing protein